MNDLPNDVFYEILRHLDPPSALHFGFSSRRTLDLVQRFTPALRSLAFALQRRYSLKAFRHQTTEPSDDPFLLYSPAYIRSVAIFGHLGYLRACPRPWNLELPKVLAKVIKFGHLDLMSECFSLDPNACQKIYYKNFSAYNKEANLRFHIELRRGQRQLFEDLAPECSKVSDPFALLRSILDAFKLNDRSFSELAPLVSYSCDKETLERYLNAIMVEPSRDLEEDLVFSLLYNFAELGRIDLIEFVLENTSVAFKDFYGSADFERCLRDMLATAFSKGQFETFDRLSARFPQTTLYEYQGLENSISMGLFERAKTYDRGAHITDYRLQDSALCPDGLKTPEMIIATMDWLHSRGLPYPSLLKALTYSTPMEVIKYLAEKPVPIRPLEEDEDPSFSLGGFAHWVYATQKGRTDVLQYFLNRFGSPFLEEDQTPASLLIKGCLSSDSYREARWIIRTFKPVLDTAFCDELGSLRWVSIKYHSANRNIEPHWITFFKSLSAPILESNALTIAEKAGNETIAAEIRRVYGLKSDLLAK